MRLNHEQIAARLPHAGRMVLLDEVSEWNDERIVCRTTVHLDRANPLYVAGQLSSVCAIEFAAQAMAVHGALLAHPSPGETSAKPRAGFLASVRNLQMVVDRLDDVAGVLTIEASRESGDEMRVLYRFDVKSGAKTLVSGRAAVVLEMPEARDRVVA